MMRFKAFYRLSVFGFGIFDILRFVGDGVIERRGGIQFDVAADKVVGRNNDVVLVALFDERLSLRLRTHYDKRFKIGRKLFDFFLPVEKKRRGADYYRRAFFAA